MQSKVQTLIARLRDLEAECLRLSTVDSSSERSAERKVYEDRLQQLEKSHSLSWFGDHSTTYYGDFQPPPGGRTFDVEWGFVPGFSGSHNPGWRIYSRDQVQEFVFRDIGESIFDALHALSEELVDKFSTVRDQALDVLEALAVSFDFGSLKRYGNRIESNLKPYRATDYIKSRYKSAPHMTRDSEEAAKRLAAPTQIQYLATIQTLEVNKQRARETAGVLRNVIEATTLHEPNNSANSQSNAIFIGHGRSEQWRVLKDFVSERLSLPYEEFNRISPAGIGTQERLSEMLDQCGFAFLVFSAEDLHDDGELHARENVIHEAGLFQGRIGWRKAIIVLEDGCEEFSNIVGLGQIRFPKGNITACFEEVRRVLEREGLLLA